MYAAYISSISKVSPPQAALRFSSVVPMAPSTLRWLRAWVLSANATARKSRATLG